MKDVRLGNVTVTEGQGQLGVLQGGTQRPKGSLSEGTEKGTRSPLEAAWGDFPPARAGGSAGHSPGAPRPALTGALPHS